LRIVEVVHPFRFIAGALRRCGLGRPMKDREKMLLAFFRKAVYDLPTTKALMGEGENVPDLDFSRLLVKKAGIGASKRL